MSIQVGDMVRFKRTDESEDGSFSAKYPHVYRVTERRGNMLYIVGWDTDAPVNPGGWYRWRFIKVRDACLFK